MLRSSNIYTVSTGPLMAAIMLKWPSVKMSLTPLVYSVVGRVARANFDALAGGGVSAQ